MSKGAIVGTFRLEVFQIQAKTIKQNNKLSQSLVTYSMLLSKVRSNNERTSKYLPLNRETSKSNLINRKSKRMQLSCNSVKSHSARNSSKMLEPSRKPRLEYPRQTRPRLLDSQVRISSLREGTSVLGAIPVFKTKLNLRLSTSLKRISLTNSTAHLMQL